MIGPGQARFNSVVVLDALPEGELRTAWRLKGDLDDIADYIAEGLIVRYFRAEDRKALLGAFSELEEQSVTAGLMPWLHFEGHGAKDETGVILANGEFISWEEFRELLVPVNVATNLNVVLLLATCYGGSFARSIRTTERAPVLALFGPIRELTAGEVEADFSLFYRTFFERQSLKEAVSALGSRTAGKLYYRVTAELFFYQAWISYKTKMCDDISLRKRAKEHQRRLRDETANRLPGIASIVRTLRREKPNIFNAFRNTYFMYDLNDANKTRFPVTYEEAERRASR